MVIKSTKFKNPLKNFFLYGHDHNLMIYSIVNQDMHTASIISKTGWSGNIVLTFETNNILSLLFKALKVRLLFGCNSGTVFNSNEINDKRIKKSEINEIT